MTTTLTPTATTRWTPPARWAVTAAHLVPLCTLPSGLWRIAFVLDLTGFDTSALTGWHWLYPVFLSVFAEALALLTLGLVQPWGERLPHWTPLLGSRRIPVLAAVIPAALGALAVTITWGYYAYGALYIGWQYPEGSTIPSDTALLVTNLCYIPLIAWGPLLAAVTVHYYRRRTR